VLIAYLNEDDDARETARCSVAIFTAMALRTASAS
jgi:hypothetical protein